ncbi:hypothetical protein [Maricaulis sp.]|uniref:hypothetical protein n=1 Tax=Maricaulis sp. TaxID=1486257 RepID=UPI003A9294CC|tara:strand:- start:1608 stop:1877 length:270 start_codon:yes stop_codon:yes gene_type:complete
MMFFVRAAFWLAIVSVFIPRDFAGDPMNLSFDSASTRIDAGQAVNSWCVERPALCEAGTEAVELGGFLAGFAATRLETAIEDRQQTSKS